MEGQINLRPSEVTEVFLVLHEHHLRPAALEYEYATGRLRKDLERQSFGEVLSEQSIERLHRLGEQLKGLQLRKIITEDFVVTRETARYLAAGAGLDYSEIVEFDPRVRESDLSYLSADEFKVLGEREAAREINATLTHWMETQPDDFRALRDDHIELWNEALRSFTGGQYLFVLHVEGVLLLTALCLGLPASATGRLLLPRNCPVHITLSPERDPIVGICDFGTWQGIQSTPYARYG
jgi:hypothetical protein